jgi:ketosteroid isomerase-like protein
MKNVILLLNFLIIAGTMSCTSPESGTFSDADREALRKLHHDITGPAGSSPGTINWEEFTKAHYAGDAIVMGPGQPAVQGHEALIAMFRTWPELTKYHTEDVEIEGSGDLAYIRGTYDIGFKLNDSTTMEDQGKYLEIWQRNEKGEWKCIRDIYNTDLQPAH